MRYTAGTLFCLLTILCALGLSCSPGAAPTPTPTSPPVAAQELGGAYEPAASGVIAGTVFWDGPLPVVKPIQVDLLEVPRFFKPNVQAPRIDKKRRTLAGALVFLKEVALERSRPWDHPAAGIEVGDDKIHVIQGGAAQMIGWSRLGQPVALVSRQDMRVNLRCRGADFFTFPLVARDRPHERRLTKAGHLEFSAASGQFWQRAHLFVSPHPYFALSDADGCFVLAGVPEGNYEVVCWHPHWEIERYDSNPETRSPKLAYFRTPLEVRQPVAVTRGATSAVEFRMRAER